MKGKKLLAGLLVGIMIVCLVPVMGYGEIEQWRLYEKVSYIQYELLRASVKYMMRNPTNFLCFELYYMSPGPIRTIIDVTFPEEVDLKDKIFIQITDKRGLLFNKSGIALLEQFKMYLDALYTYIEHIATDMDNDIVTVFYSKGDIPLGYFYQGEYHLWEE